MDIIDSIHPKISNSIFSCETLDQLAVCDAFVSNETDPDKRALINSLIKLKKENMGVYKLFTIMASN